MNGNETPAGRPCALTAPVSRALAVSDPARTVAFYRDVLGFEERAPGRDAGVAAVAELVRGPARIQLVPATTPADHAPPGVVFFETDDVAGLHAAVAARGGSPTLVARLNRIKYEVFEVRDPDGHALWFGQSYDHPDLERPQAMMLEAIPQLPVDEVPAAVTYYRDVLGFGINYQQDDLGVMYRDRVTVLLVPRGRPDPGPGAAEFYVRDADALHAELSGRGARVQGEPLSHPWGLRDFRVLDHEGNLLIFAQPFE